MDKIDKYYGADEGAWWCGLKDCNLVITTPDLKNLDALDEISWALLIEGGKVVHPICPEHGTLLQYADKDTDAMVM